MTLYCALCLVTRDDLADEARTSINGTAVCYKHAKVMSSGDYATTLAYLATTLASLRDRT